MRNRFFLSLFCIGIALYSFAYPETNDSTQIITNQKSSIHSFENIVFKDSLAISDSITKGLRHSESKEINNNSLIGYYSGYCNYCGGNKYNMSIAHESYADSEVLIPIKKALPNRTYFGVLAECNSVPFSGRGGAAYDAKTSSLVIGFQSFCGSYAGELTARITSLGIITLSGNLTHLLTKQERYFHFIKMW